MKRIQWLFASALLLAGCASAPPEQAIVNGAATALGGADKIQAANNFVMEFTGEQGNLGQNLTPEAPLPIFKVTEGKSISEFGRDRVKVEVTRVPTFVTANTAPQKQIQGLDGTIAYNVAGTAAPTRASDAVATDRRMTLYHHPLGILRAALTQGTQLANPRKEGNDDVVDITTAQGQKLTLFVDGTTKLPTKVVSMTSNPTNWPLGDAVVETSFADYADAGGLKLPGRITSKTDKYTTSVYQVSKNSINAEVGDLAAPEAAKSAAIPTVTAMVTAE